MMLNDASVSESVGREDTRVSFLRHLDLEDSEEEGELVLDSGKEVNTLLHSRRLWKERTRRIRTPVRHKVLQLRTMQPSLSNDPRQIHDMRALEQQVRADEVSKLSEDMSSTLIPLHVERGPLEQTLLRLHTTTPATVVVSRATTSKTKDSKDTKDRLPPVTVTSMEMYRTGTSMTGYSVLSEPYEPLYMLSPDRSLPSRPEPPRRHKSFCQKWRSMPRQKEGIHFQKGVHQTDMFSRRELADRQEINGPIQKQLYESYKADLLRPLLGRGTMNRQLNLKGSKNNTFNNLVKVRPAKIELRGAKDTAVNQQKQQLKSGSDYTITRPNTRESSARTNNKMLVPII